MSRTRIILAATVAVALAGCGGPSAAPAARPAAQPKPAPKAEDKGQTADAAPAYVYAYNPLGKRDPFRSAMQDQVRATRGDVVCNDPLCMWDLDQLVLVAVVTGDSDPIAMVEDPKGRGYIVKRNSRMGKQGGKVTQVLRDSITVTEYWADPTGKVIPKPTQKMIKEEKNVVPALDLVSGKTFE
jgi:type IV pilus assembly protein PilP